MIEFILAISAVLLYLGIGGFAAHKVRDDSGFAMFLWPIIGLFYIPFALASFKFRDCRKRLFDKSPPPPSEILAGTICKMMLEYPEWPEDHRWKHGIVEVDFRYGPTVLINYKEYTFESKMCQKIISAGKASRKLQKTYRAVEKNAEREEIAMKLIGEL